MKTEIQELELGDLLKSLGLAAWQGRSQLEKYKLQPVMRVRDYFILNPFFKEYPCIYMDPMMDRLLRPPLE